VNRVANYLKRTTANDSERQWMPVIDSQHWWITEQLMGSKIARERIKQPATGSLTFVDVR
jgi:hypothetical protein